MAACGRRSRLLACDRQISQLAPCGDHCARPSVTKIAGWWSRPLARVACPAAALWPRPVPASPWSLRKQTCKHSSVSRTRGLVTSVAIVGVVAIGVLTWSLSTSTPRKPLDYSRIAARPILDPWTFPRYKGVPSKLSSHESMLFGGFFSCSGAQLSNRQLHAHPVRVSLYFRNRLLASQDESRGPAFGFFLTGMPNTDISNPPTMTDFIVSSGSSRAAATVISGGAEYTQVILKICPRRP